MSRIHAPVAYAYVRNVNIVRVVHLEALGLAASFPVVWRRGHSTFELVAVRSLLEDGRGHSPGTLRNPNILPLLLRAYPFVLTAALASSHNPDEEKFTVTMDQALADRPTDTGAPMTTEGDKLARGVEQRHRALAIFAQALPLTRLITQRLAEKQVLVPWPLAATVDASLLAHDDLHVIHDKWFATGHLRSILAQCGTAAAFLLTAHRLSLFRAGTLVTSAKRALGDARKAQGSN